jgi:glycosyltransferase involved in cell wall biosynthesis
MPALPKITLALPVLNEERDIGRCLESIHKQDYPPELLEVIVADGGSTDRTEEIVRSFGYRFLHNPHKLAEPGLALAYTQASGDLFVHMAADNELRETNWLREMVQPFLADENVVGAFCRVECNPGDNAFLKYFNFDTDPFSTFVYWNASHPETLGKRYPVKKDAGSYVIYQFDARYYPLVALAQGFILRRSYPRPADTSHDDIQPLVGIIRDGHDLAYVRTVTIGHYIFDNFAHYRRRMLRKVSESFTQANHGFHVREKALPWPRRLRQYLFIPWALTGIGPLFSALSRFSRTGHWHHFYHVPASFLLAVYISRMVVEVRLLKLRKTPTGKYH